MMKKLTVLIILGMIFSAFVVSEAAEYNFWVWGIVKGSAKERVITVQVKHDMDDYVRAETSTNKYNQYAFSNVGLGNPSEYRLVFIKGDQVVKEVDITNTPVGGRMPDVFIP